jgi:integrase/recombinase XerD
VPLIRTPRTLPRVVSPSDVDTLLAALRTRRDQAMGAQGAKKRDEIGTIRCRPPFPSVMNSRRSPMLRPPTSATERLFAVLKGPRCGWPLSAAGLDEILEGACARAGLPHVSCHQLRHTCFTQLWEAGMALQAIQAQAGHASIESTRISLHLANGWLAGEY